MHPSTHLSIYPSIHPSIYPSIYLSIYCSGSCSRGGGSPFLICQAPRYSLLLRTIQCHHHHVAILILRRTPTRATHACVPFSILLLPSTFPHLPSHDSYSCSVSPHVSRVEELNSLSASSAAHPIPSHPTPCHALSQPTPKDS